MTPMVKKEGNGTLNGWGGEKVKDRKICGGTTNTTTTRGQTTAEITFSLVGQCHWWDECDVYIYNLYTNRLQTTATNQFTFTLIYHLTPSHHCYDRPQPRASSSSSSFIIVRSVGRSSTIFGPVRVHFIIFCFIHPHLTIKRPTDPTRRIASLHIPFTSRQGQTTAAVNCGFNSNRRLLQLTLDKTEWCRRTLLNCSANRTHKKIDVLFQMLFPKLSLFLGNSGALLFLVIVCPSRLIHPSGTFTIC